MLSDNYYCRPFTFSDNTIAYTHCVLCEVLAGVAALHEWIGTPSAMAWAVLVAMWRLLLIIVGKMHRICLAVFCKDFFYKGCNTNLSSAQTDIYSPTTCSLTPHPSLLTPSPLTPEPGTGGRQSIVSFATGHHENHENRAKKTSLTTPQTSLTSLLASLVIVRPLLLHKIQMLVTMATC